MTRTKSSRALVSVVLAVLMAVAFMPAISFSSFAATAKKATKVTKVYHKANTTFTRTAGTAWTLKYKLSPSKLTAAAKKVVWKSSNKSVVSVSAKSGNRAAVSFKKAGTATVTVYTKANKKAKATWKFKVVNAPAKVAATGVTVKANNVADDYTKILNVGTELTATVAPADATGVTYQWYADGTAIEGATSSQFTVTAAQSGKTITVKATDDSKNTVESAKSATVGTVTIDSLALDKTSGIKVGDTVKVTGTAGSTPIDANVLSNSVDVQWYRVKKATNGTSNESATAISGATGTSYKTTADDQGYSLRAVVTPKSGVKVATVILKDGKATLNTADGENGKVAAANTTISKVNIKANGKDLESGKDYAAGTVLTAVVDPEAGANAVDYQWYKNGYKIDGATSASYTPSETGTYIVKITLKSTETTYQIASNLKNTDSVSVKAAAKEFSGVSTVNVTGTNEKRTTNLATDKYAVEVSGLKYGTDYTVKWYKEVKDAYGNVTTPAYLGKGQTYTDTAAQLNDGVKIYAVVTGAGTTYKDYESKTSTITIDAAAATTIPEFTLPTTDNKAVTTTYTPDTGNKIVWQKAPVSTIGLDTTWTDTTTTGSTYQLSTAEQAGGFMLRAKVVDANGKVVGYSSNTLTATTTNGVLAFSTAATVIK